MSEHVLPSESAEQPVKHLGEYHVEAFEYIEPFRNEKNFTTSWRVTREEKCCITDKNGTTECKYFQDGVLLENAKREDAIAKVREYQLEDCCKELERSLYELRYIKLEQEPNADAKEK